MSNDAIRPAGDEASEPQRSTRNPVHTEAAPRAAGVQAASKFIGRVSQLDGHAIRSVVQAWHQLMRDESNAWFAAEQATAQAVPAAGRTAEQEVLLGHLADSVLRGVWYRNARPHQTLATPETRVGATEASAQYVSSVAMLALLVRDYITPADFAVLYRPFARLIPDEDLGPE